MSRAAWNTLLGTNTPKWVYPVFGAAAAAPVVGYELDKAREARERRAAAAAASAVKAAFAVASELAPGSVGNLQRMDRLGAALRSARARSHVQTDNKPKTVFRQDADTVSTGNTGESQGSTQEFATE